MTGHDEELGLTASAPPLPSHQDTPSSSRMHTPRTERLSSGTSDKDGLYEDLLRRAGGDRQVVSLWLAEMGYEPGQFAEQQQQAGAAVGTIKAVGTRSETRLGKWATAGSLTTAANKTKLALTDDKEADLKDLDLDAAEEGAPRHFFCPISMHLMRDPVMVPTGQSYERVCIERWLLQGNSTCPATGQQLQRPVVLTPNVSLRNAIEEWAEKYAPRLLDPTTSRIRPIPKEDSFALPAPEQPAAHDPDLALAIRLQHEELARIAASRQSQPSQRQGSGAAAAVAQQPSRRASSRSQQAQQPQQLLASRSGRSSQRNGSSNGSGNGAAATDTRARAEWGTWSTLLLLAISAGYIAVYVLSIWKNGWTVEDLTLNPLVGAAQPALMTLGAQTRASLTEDGQWWRLASSMFVTAGVIQLLGNLTSLWAFGKYLERVLPLPFFSLSGIFLLSGALGALASANLNAYYLTCGASAGVCGFLGGIWADQIFNFKRYTNRVVTMLVLALITTVFVLISLLPLLDPFYTVAALLTGFCSTTILLLLAKVGRDHPGSCGWVVMQTLCAVVLIGGATVAAIGLVTDSGVGPDCEFCKDISCLQVKWWECQEVSLSVSSGSCSLTVLADGDQGLQCPSGDVKTLSEPVPPGSDLQALCSQYCVPGSSPAPSPAPGGSGSGGSGSGSSGGGSGSTGGGGSGSGGTGGGGDAGGSSSGAQGSSGGSDIIR